MDDILVWGSTMEQHDSRLHIGLEWAEKAGVTLNMSKCEFGKKKSQIPWGSLSQLME